MNLGKNTGAVFAIALFMVALSGCRGTTSEQTQLGGIRNMHEVPRYDPQARGCGFPGVCAGEGDETYFEDHRSMRPPVPGAIAREMEVNDVVDTGIIVADDGAESWVPRVPMQVVRRARNRTRNEDGDEMLTQEGWQALVTRGEERYGIYCTPCHGGLGNGQGAVAERAAELNVASLLDDRILHMPDGQLYATIRNGKGLMPAYRAQMPVDDRWAIVSYVRALQLSQADERTAMRMEPTQ